MIDNRKFDARLDVVPTSPGVYLMKDASDSVIYVGKAKNLRNRLRSYFMTDPAGNEKVLAMISHIADFEYIEVKTELEAFLLESNMIKRYQPFYNILLRDDKGYPYICVTMHELYPRVFRAFRIGPDKEKGAKYYGPYLTGDLFRALRTLRELFPMKSCAKILPRDIGKERPCLNMHIGTCIGPCKGDVPVEEYREVMENICRFLEGKYAGIQKDMQRQMMDAAEKEAYEQAAIWRDRLQSLERLMESQKVEFVGMENVDVIGMHRDAGEICIRKVEIRDGRMIGSPTYFFTDCKEEDHEIVGSFLERHYTDADYIPREILLCRDLPDNAALETFLGSLAGHRVYLRVPQRGDAAKLLRLANDNAASALLRRVLRVGDSEGAISTALTTLADYTGLEGGAHLIEAYDISNLGDDDRCGGMVAFRGGRPDKSRYRLFRIRRTQGQNDLEAMREMLERRFSEKKGEELHLPDLILIDGGHTHLALSMDVLAQMGLSDRVRAAGMVKDKKHRTRGLALPDGRTIELQDLAPTDTGSLVLLRLLTAIQNEVHRYAGTYQKKLSKKRHLSFKLENIPGIGPAKRRVLLAHFGSIGKIRDAAVEELATAKGISQKDAEAIFGYFHQEKEGI